MKKIIMDSSWVLYFSSDRRDDLPIDEPRYSVSYLWRCIKKKIREFFTDGPNDILVVIDEKHPDVDRVHAIVVHSCVKSYHIEIIRGWMFFEARTWNEAQHESVKDLLLRISPSTQAVNSMRTAAQLS